MKTKTKNTMKTSIRTLSICLTGLVISLGFYACNDDNSDNVKPLPPTPTEANNTMEVLLTDNLIKEWRLVNIYDEANSSINTLEWSDCKKSEILTFHSDKTFSVSCSNNAISIFSWNVIEIEDKNFLNLESIENSSTPSEWLAQEIIIHVLTDNILVIEINGMNHEYRPVYLENRNPRDYQ